MIRFLMGLGLCVSLCAAEPVQPVVVLGSGVGALTSAVYLARAGVPPLVITGPAPGGAIAQSHSVQNWPGEFDISGEALAERIRDQALKNGALFEEAIVTEVDFSSRPLKLKARALFDTEEREILAHACIIALGSTPKRLGVQGEDEYWARGVYTCAVCDGALYKDKVVAVVGGGESALTEAHYLAGLAKKVYVIMRKDQFRSMETERVKAVTAHANVEIVRNAEVLSIQGDEKQVKKVVVRDRVDQQLSDYPVDAVFVAIGTTPNTQLFTNQLELDAQGYIALRRHQETSAPGVYAVGDITDPEFQQAISAAGDAAKAALQAHQFLAVMPKGIQEVRSMKELQKLLDIGPVVIDFYGDFCAPCRSFAPVYEKWAQKWGDQIAFVKADASVASELFAAYQVQTIPTVIVFEKGGRLLKRGSGMLQIAEISKELEFIGQKTL